MVAVWRVLVLRGDLNKGILYLLIFLLFAWKDRESKDVREGRWEPIQISRNGPLVSHLFIFPGEVLLFAKAKASQAKVIKRVLDSFCSISGLKVSLAKSRVSFSLKVCLLLREPRL